MGGIKGLDSVKAALNQFDDVATAQKRGANVQIKATENKIRSIPSIGNSEAIVGSKGGVVSVSPATALKVSVHAVKQKIVNGHGLWTWQHMQARIPELNKNQINSTSEAKALKKQIESAYKNALDVGHEVDKVLKQKNAAVEAPMQSTNFSDYVDELKERGNLLAAEFSPGGKNWQIVAMVSKVDDPFILMDQAALKEQIGLRVKHHVETYGKLPTRQKVLEMAAQQASYLNQPTNGFAADDADIVDISLTDLSSDLAGFKDFPSQKMRDLVEDKARQVVAAGGDFKDAMNVVYVNGNVMYPLYEERLQDQFFMIETALSSADAHPRELTAQKVKILMPGSRFYQFLSSNMEGPKLNGEAVDAYQRLLFTKLGEASNSMGIVDIAKAAYVCAQKTQMENKGPKNDQTFQVIAKPFTPELQTQLATQGEINWVGFADDAGVKLILEDLKTVIDQPLEGGFGDTFLRDSNRSTFTFHFGNDKTISNVSDDSQRRTSLAKDGIRAIVGHDDLAAATLSQVLSQTGIGSKPNAVLTNLYHQDFEKDAVFLRDGGTTDKPLDELDQNLEYTVTMTSPDTLSVTYDLYVKADQMVIGGEMFPINRDHKLAGNVSPINYGIHQKTAVELKIDDLKKGFVNPKMLGKPMIEMHVKPDWGRIAVEQQESEFNGKISAYNTEETKLARELAFSLGNDFEKAYQICQERMPIRAALSKLTSESVGISDSQEILVRHQFSDESKARLKAEIERLSTAEDPVGQNIDLQSGLPEQYLRDLDRQTNFFTAANGTTRQSENAAQTIAMLNRFAGSRAAARALACACNQATNLSVMREHAESVMSGGTVILGVSQKNQTNEFKLKRLENGNVALHFERLAPLKTVGVAREGVLLSSLNRPWEHSMANQENYDFKCAADIEFDNTELLKGNLKIVNSPEYVMDFKLRPSWETV